MSWDRNLLIEIYVPTQDGGGTIATGYPVAKDRILTAGHIFRDRDREKAIGVRWCHQKNGEARNWRPITKIVWDGGDTFDAAVIDCAFPTACSTWGVLTEVKPEDHMPWASEGFARAGRRNDNSRQPIPMLGQLSGAADTQAEFWLGANYEVSVDSSWAGASGSPVFVYGKIIGVIVSCPPNFNQRWLRATPSWKLLADPGFREAIGYDDRIKRLEKVKRLIAKELKSSSETMDALGNLKKDADPSDRAKALAEMLVNKSIEEAVEILEKAHRSMQEDVIEDKVIRRVTQWLIPAVFDPAMIEWLRTRRTDITAAVVPLPAATRTVAEVIMAGMDRRRLRMPSVTGRQWPEGRFCIQMPPESGFDSDGQAFKEAFDTYIIREFTNPVMRAQRDRKTLIQYVADELNYDARQKGRTWYFIYSFYHQASGGIDIAVKQLKQQYQALVFIGLLQDDELFLRETRLLRPVRDLLWDEDEAGKGD